MTAEETQLQIKVAAMRVKLVHKIRSIGYNLGNTEFSNYIEKILKTPTPDANIARAVKVFQVNCLHSEIELLEDLYFVYNDLVYKV
jgi:hypothetical protein